MATYTINTHSASPPPPPRPARGASGGGSGRAVLASVLGIVLLTGLGIATYLLWPARLPADDAPPAEVIKFMATDQFARLSDDRKQRYVGMLARNFLGALVAAQSIPEETQDLAFANAMQAMWNQRLDEWLKLDAKGKEAFVQKALQQRRDGAATRPSASPGAVAGAARRFGHQNITPERQKRFIENMPPDRRAAMAEMMGAMRKAREQKK